MEGSTTGWTRTARLEPSRYSRPLLDQVRKCESLIKALKPLSDTPGPPVKGRPGGRQSGAPHRQVSSPRRVRAMAAGLPLSPPAPMATATRSPAHSSIATIGSTRRAPQGKWLPRSMSEPLGLGARPRRLDPLKHTPRGTPLDHPVLFGVPARLITAHGSNCPSASSTPTSHVLAPARSGSMNFRPAVSSAHSKSPKGVYRESARKVADSRVEESSALQQISSTAVWIAEDLRKVQRSCKIFTEQRGVEDSDMEKLALSQISSVTFQICDNLTSSREEDPRDDASASAPCPPETHYDDPMLARARVLNAMTNRLCDDLAATCRNISTNRHDDQVNSLQEISAATHRVCEDMGRFQEGFAQALAAERHREEGGAGGGAAEAWEAAAAQEQDAEPEPPAGADAAAQPASPRPAARADGDLQELLERLASHARGFDGFTEKEAQRLRGAFERFKVPDSADLHKDDMEGLLRYLGHVMTEQEGLLPLVKDVTSYDYLDFDEFLTFMERYVVYEREQFRRVFNKYDADQSGEISLKELRQLTSALGFAPHWAMVVEALSVVNADIHGQLTFDQLVAFLAVYRHSEGFTRTEVAEFRRIFEHFARRAGGEPALQPEDLGDALVQVFGLQVADSTRALSEELRSGGGLQASSLQARSGEADGIGFPEFLIFARKVREAELRRYHSEYPAWGGTRGRLKLSELSLDGAGFEASDADCSGGISMEELRGVLQKLQYTPLSQVMDEVFAEILQDDWTPERELDFDEFFDFMLIFRQRDGFSKAEVEAMRLIFDRFDADASGVISALELSDLLRHLGYSVTLDDIHDFVAVVDANGSNDLDFREFLRLMRLYREAELLKVRRVFDSFRDSEDPDSLLPLPALVDALEALDHDPPKEKLLGPNGFSPNGLDFDELVGVVDSCRADLVARQRKKAGFNDQEIAHFQELFEQIDRDRSGEIDPRELLLLLKEFNWEPKTREEQAALLKKLDVARAAAREAEVEDISPDGSSSFKFWEFIQLARMLRSQHDRAHEDAMAKVMEELKFTQVEVDQFRQVFRSWSKRDNVFEGSEEAGTPDTLPRDVVRRLVRSLGVSITPENKGKLDDKLATLDDGGLLDFIGFLRLMRWLTDTNFAGVNEAAARRT